MSIVGMRNKMHGWSKYVLYVIVAIFFVGAIYMGFGSYYGRNQDKERSAVGGLMAKVNGESLDRETFESTYRQNLMMYARQMNPMADPSDAAQIEQSMSPLQLEAMRAQSLDQQTLMMALLQEAEKERIRVSGRDVNRAVDKMVESQIDQEKAQFKANYKGKDADKAFEAVLKARGTSIGMMRTQLREGIDKDRMRQEMMIQKLMQKVTSKVDVSDKAVRASYDQVKLHQITIGTQKRSADQAEQRAKEIVDKLRKGESFEALAREFSDDPYKDKGGDWGTPMPVRYLQSPIDQVVLSLKTGEISDPIKTPMGYAIVRVDARESKLPADYSDPKKQKQYKEDYVSIARNKAQQDFMQKLHDSAKIVIVDKEMLAFSKLRNLMSSADKKKVALDAIKLYKEALDGVGQDSQSGARVSAQIAMLYEMLRKPGLTTPTKQEQVDYRAEEKAALLEALRNVESNDLRMMLVDVYMEEKEYAKAEESLTIISENSYNDPQTHEQILKKYQEMAKSGYAKAAEKVAEEQKWISENKKQQAAMGPQTMPGR